MGSFSWNNVHLSVTTNFQEPHTWLLGSDVVVVDPPRKGLDPSLLGALQSVAFMKRNR